MPVQFFTRLLPSACFLFLFALQSLLIHLLMLRRNLLSFAQATSNEELGGGHAEEFAAPKATVGTSAQGPAAAILGHRDEKHETTRPENGEEGESESDVREQTQQGRRPQRRRLLGRGNLNIARFFDPRWMQDKRHLARQGAEHRKNQSHEARLDCDDGGGTFLVGLSNLSCVFPVLGGQQVVCTHRSK